MEVHGLDLLRNNKVLHSLVLLDKMGTRALNCAWTCISVHRPFLWRWFLPWTIIVKPDSFNPIYQPTDEHVHGKNQKCAVFDEPTAKMMMEREKNKDKRDTGKTILGGKKMGEEKVIFFFEECEAWPFFEISKKTFILNNIGCPKKSSLLTIFSIIKTT